MRNGRLREESPDFSRGERQDWYMDEVHELIKMGVLGRYKKREVDAVYLNLGAKKLIEDMIMEI